MPSALLQGSWWGATGWSVAVNSLLLLPVWLAGCWRDEGEGEGIQEGFSGYNFFLSALREVSTFLVSTHKADIGNSFGVWLYPMTAYEVLVLPLGFVSSKPWESGSTDTCEICNSAR